MKTYTLSGQYVINNITKGGDVLDITYTTEGIQVKDFIFLANHPDLANEKYEVIKIWNNDENLYARLAKVPVSVS